ncbi:MAG TPA: hypothetical protein PKE63_12565 [Lacibacter sp.]|nr:hypothetical protein [Lacibacter sp.]HMO88882.1 hypothetical protein [Lacibacter sp.]HMP88104.1 hypothetical protein [Lacibacter sp.]
MKAAWLITHLLLLAGTVSQAQGKYPVKKIYAYSFRVKPGVVQLPAAERRGPVLQYRVYLEPWPGRAVTVNRAWLQGKDVSMVTEKATGPIRKEKAGRLPGQTAYEMLVPGSGNELIEIFPGVPRENGTPYPRHLRLFPLLLEYSCDGKTHYLGTSFRPLSADVRL